MQLAMMSAILEAEQKEKKGGARPSDSPIHPALALSVEVESPLANSPMTSPSWAHTLVSLVWKASAKRKRGPPVLARTVTAPFPRPPFHPLRLLFALAIAPAPTPRAFPFLLRARPIRSRWSFPLLKGKIFCLSHSNSRVLSFPLRPLPLSMQPLLPHTPLCPVPLLKL